MSRILVIDDDVDLCDLLTDYLTPEGLEVKYKPVTITRFQPQARVY